MREIRKKARYFWVLSILAILTVFGVGSTVRVEAFAIPSIETTSKNVYVGKTRKLSIKNPLPQAKTSWSSSDTAIATVSKKGKVKGIQTGNVTITLTSIYQKKTYTYQIPMKVKEHAEEISIVNAVGEQKLGLGKKVFTYKTATRTRSGSETTDLIRYIITENTAGATVNKKGQVTIQQPGSFQIKAVAVNSVADFKKQKYQAESKSLTVIVPVAYALSLKTANQIEVSSSLGLPNKSIESFKIRDIDTEQIMKIVAMETAPDGMSTILTTEKALVRGAAYDVIMEHEGGSKEEILDVIYGEIHKIEVADADVPVGIPVAVSYRVYDSNGFDITAVYPYDRDGMNFYFTENYSLDSQGKLTLAKDGAFTLVTVEYNRDNTKIAATPAKITARAATVENIEKWTIVTNGSNVDWSQVNHNLVVGDMNKRLYIKLADSAGGSQDSFLSSLAGLTYKSSDETILQIDAYTGLLYPYKGGNVQITATMGEFVARIPITIGTTRAVTSLSADSDRILMGKGENGSFTMDTNKAIFLELKDQYGDTILPKSTQIPSVSVVSGDEGIVSCNGTVLSKKASNVVAYQIKTAGFHLNLVAVKTGKCVLKVTYEGVSKQITVEVKNAGEAAGYQAFLINDTVELGASGANTAYLKIYTVDANGFRLTEKVVDGFYSILKADETVVYKEQYMPLTYKEGYGVAINADLLKLEAGEYKIVAFEDTISLGEATLKVTSKGSDYQVQAYTGTITVNSYDDVFTQLMNNLKITSRGDNVGAAFLNMNGTLLNFESMDEGNFPGGLVVKNGRTFGGRSGYQCNLNIKNISVMFGTIQYQIPVDLTMTIIIR